MSSRSVRKPSPIVKHSVAIGGHKTSVSLEGPFWRHVVGMAHRQGQEISELVSKIDQQRQHNNLSSALRLAVIADLQAQIPAQPAPAS